MRRKCHTCLCWTCMTVCCDRKNCIGKKESCEGYSGFRQLSIFDIFNDPQEEEQEYKAAPRYPLSHYGLTEERVAELKNLIQSGRYTSEARQAAHTANEMIEEYILLAVTKKRSYEAVEYVEGMGRIPCGRTDFYGYRRLFYHLFDMEVNKNGTTAAK